MMVKRITIEADTSALSFSDLRRLGTAVEMLEELAHDNPSIALTAVDVSGPGVLRKRRRDAVVEKAIQPQMMDILRALAQHPEPITAPALSHELSLKESSIRAQLNTLHHRGLLGKRKIKAGRGAPRTEWWVIPIPLPVSTTKP